MNRLISTIWILCFAVGCASAPATGPRDIAFLNPPELAARGLPFSEAVRVDNMLYLSGQLGTLPGTATLAPGGVAEETRQTLENIKATLERYGSSMDKVVKCTVFLVDIDEWPAMNAVYRTYFTGHYPARSTVAGTGLALGARVEIECIAVID